MFPGPQGLSADTRTPQRRRPSRTGRAGGGPRRGAAGTWHPAPRRAPSRHPAPCGRPPLLLAPHPAAAGGPGCAGAAGQEFGTRRKVGAGCAAAAATMSGSSNVAAMKKVVQQLRLEASVTRVKVRRGAAPPLPPRDRAPPRLRGGGRAGGAVLGAGRGPGPPAPLRPSWEAAELRPGGSAAPGLGPGPVASYSCPWPPECRGGASLPPSWPAAGEGLLPAQRRPGGLLRWGLQQVASAGPGNGGFAARRTGYAALGVLGAPPGRAEPEER